MTPQYTSRRKRRAIRDQGGSDVKFLRLPRPTRIQSLGITRMCSSGTRKDAAQLRRSAGVSERISSERKRAIFVDNPLG